jgi:hypothetical protein
MLFLLHFCITWALIGLIWTIQLVHYPLFHSVGKSHFIAYHEKHMRFIAWLVAPLMLAEIGSAALLLFLGERSMLFLLSLLGIMLVWVSTLCLQIPIHQKLCLSYCKASVDRLVTSNWLRTLAWTARGMLLFPYIS